MLRGRQSARRRLARRRRARRVSRLLAAPGRHGETVTRAVRASRHSR